MVLRASGSRLKRSHRCFGVASLKGSWGGVGRLEGAIAVLLIYLLCGLSCFERFCRSIFGVLSGRGVGAVCRDIPPSTRSPTCGIWKLWRFFFPGVEENSLQFARSAA